MDLIKKIVLCLCVAAATSLSAYTLDTQGRVLDRDYEALQHFVNSKRTIPLNEKAGFLKIAGDARTEYIFKRERLDQPLEVPFRKSKHAFAVKLNLGVDYKTDNTHAFAKLQFSNAAGIAQNIHPKESDDINGLFGSGSDNRIFLKEAWMTYKLPNYCGYDYDAVVFLGRIALDKKFESAIQFGTIFNGILLDFNKKFQPNWKLYSRLGAFVVDERVDHYAYVGEVGVLDFMESKVDVIYNFITWNECGRNRADTKHPAGFKFRNSQIYVAYNIPHIYAGFDGKIYGAFLYNHAARRHPLRLNSRQNKACYCGFTTSHGRKKGDLTLKVEYQAVEAQAVPDLDANGFGNGNFQGHTFTDGSFLGEGNFQGFKVSSVYYFLDCLVLENSYTQTAELKKSLGGKHRFRKVASELIVQF